VRQVFVDARAGIAVEEVPAPVRGPGQLLVQTHFSLISAGTESTSARAAGGILKRAIARPDLVKRVARRALERGLGDAAALVQSRLDRLSPLGYSLSGRVVETDPESDLPPGQLVACAGAAYAYHAELVSVPRNLAVPLPPGVVPRAGAFATLGAIALQGVRRARPEIGETVAVVGLGLVGQLVAQLLAAHGCRAIGLDTRPERVELARRTGALVAGGAPGAEADALVARLTDGQGVDAVVVTAATASSEPANWALGACRERGRVVIVGDVGMALEREPFYRGELDLVMSRSYGPGRYDPTYEELGVDYPFGLVRWTENRNLAAFLDLLARRRVDVEPLTTHTFGLESAREAYAVATGGQGVGVLFDYRPPTERDGARPPAAAAGAPSTDQTPAPAEVASAADAWLDGPPLARRLDLPRRAAPTSGRLRLGVIGPGYFFQSVHLPNLRRRDDVELRAVAARTGWTARRAAEATGAAYCATDYAELLADADLDAVLVGTRHDLHAEIAAAALAAGKHVFVEKPLGLSVDECRRVGEAVAASGRLLTVGFNRRCAPLARRLKEWLRARPGPAVATFQVEAGALPREHWLLSPTEGGGRILGEGCHFVDFLCWLLDGTPTSVSAVSPGDPSNELTCQLAFPDGSIGLLVYSGRGDGALGKEHLRGARGGASFELDDFAELSLAERGRVERRRARQDKGHAGLLASFVAAAAGRADLAATAADGLRATAICLAAVQSARQAGAPVPIDLEGADALAREV
jgi:predicted dehydrogenase/threonine dehydrogenase-like Zn-dependent dehydrogenase